MYNSSNNNFYTFVGVARIIAYPNWNADVGDETNDAPDKAKDVERRCYKNPFKTQINVDEIKIRYSTIALTTLHFYSFLRIVGGSR